MKLIVTKKTGINDVEEAIINGWDIGYEPNLSKEWRRRLEKIVSKAAEHLIRTETYPVLDDSTQLDNKEQQLDEEQSSLDKIDVTQSTIQMDSNQEKEEVMKNLTNEVLEEVIIINENKEEITMTKEETTMTNQPTKEELKAKQLIEETKIEEVVKVVEEHGTPMAKEKLESAINSGDFEKIKKAGMSALFTTQQKIKDPKVKETIKDLGQSFYRGITKLLGSLASIGLKALKILVGCVKWIWNSAYGLFRGIIKFTIDIVMAVGRSIAHIGVTGIESIGEQAQAIKARHAAAKAPKEEYVTV